MRDRRTVFEGQVAGAAARRDAFGDADLAQRSRPRQRRHRHLWRAVRQPTPRSPSSRPRPSAISAGSTPSSARRSARRSSVAVKSTHAVVDDHHRQGRRGARSDRRRCARSIRIMGAGEVVEIYKEVGLPGAGRRPLRRAQHGRHARHRPHPHGDGIGGDDDGRASVLDRRRPVPGAQRLAVQPQQCPPRADPRGHEVRDRERHRGRGRLSLVARWRMARISARRWKAR